MARISNSKRVYLSFVFNKKKSFLLSLFCPSFSIKKKICYSIIKLGKPTQSVKFSISIDTDVRHVVDAYEL